MIPVPSRGDKNSPIWFLGYQPTEKDASIGHVFGDSVGYHLNKMAKEAGLPDCYYTTIQPCWDVKVDNNLAIQLLQTKLTATPNKPIIIATCDSRYGQHITKKGEEKEDEKIWISDALALLCPETGGILNKYAGSLLTSKYLGYPHYIIPTYSPYFIWRNYEQRAITVSLDYGHIREEFEYWRTNHVLNPLPSYELIVEPAYPILMEYLSDIIAYSKLVSSDIETIRPVQSARLKNSKYNGMFRYHPGYPYTLGLAKSPKSGISFSLWDYEYDQLIKIWRKIAYILANISQVGQNYFNFDSHMLAAIGLDVNIDICQDTLIRHHILHAELPHKLQFLTRQYTRQPFYKDEAKQWTYKNKKSLMKYNALDVVVTYAVYEEQEKEFNDKPHLK